MEGERVYTCCNCLKKVKLRLRRPKDFLCLADVSLMVFIIISTMAYTSFTYLIFIIASAVVGLTYLIAKKELYCPKCSIAIKDYKYLQVMTFMLLFVYAIVDFVFMVILTYIYSADAVYGIVSNDHYYLGDHHNKKVIEVEWYIYQISLLGTRLYFVFIGLGLLFAIAAKSSKANGMH